MKTCEIKNCERTVYTGKLCRTHTRWAKDGRDMSRPIRPLKKSSEHVQCSIPGCSKLAGGAEYCRNCYERWKRNGGPLVPVIKPLVTIDSNGYARLCVSHPLYKKKNTFEHIAVMQEFLGRELYPEENIHHKNGVRADNRIENLELWVRPQPTGIKIEDAVKWAREVLIRYEDHPSVL